MKTSSYPSRRHGLRRLLSTALAVAPMLVTPALAHPGHYHPPGEADEFDSFAAGLFHPFTGIDHALLALAIGWLLFTRLDRAAMLKAACFLLTLLAGALLGRFFGATPGLEAALGGTVLCSSILFLHRRHPQGAVLLSVASLSGLIHGVAHGAEASPGVAFAPYAAGMLAGTAVLLAAGCLLGRASALARSALPPRVAGAALLASGAVFLWNAL